MKRGIEKRFWALKAVLSPGETEVKTLGDLRKFPDNCDEYKDTPFASITCVSLDGEKRTVRIELLPSRLREGMPENLRKLVVDTELDLYRELGERKVVSQSSSFRVIDLPIIRELKQLPRFASSIIVAIIAGEI